MNQIPTAPQIKVSSENSLGSFLRANKKTVLIIALVLFSVLAFKFVSSEKTITVVGTGQMSVVPEQVEMVVTRIDTGTNAADVISQGEGITKNLIDKVKSISGNNIEIQRSFYSITPTVINSEINYQLINAFKIVSNDPDKTSELIKTLYGAGATTISGVNFLPADQDDITQEARKLAVKDAKKEARKLAGASGKILGGIITIADDLTQAGGVISTQGATAEGTDLAQISGGAEADFSLSAPDNIDITKNVSVTYRIW